jgi:3-dehydroquinate synthase
VRVGSGARARLIEELLAEPPGARLFLIADDNVARLHGRSLAAELRDRGLDAELLEFPAGEASKTRATKQVLEDRLFELGAGRDCAIVAVGGGVTCDLAGFVAATWHRGVPLVHVPTSLLAMVDAAIGGKTAVDLPGGKNLVGAFHQPEAVYADVDLLSTLPDAYFVEGLAEVVKSAVIGDASLFREMESSAERLLARDEEWLERVVLACATLKGRIVRRDERETGRRAVLNFGHTVAHAVETVSNYTVRHGHAVAYGMCVESRLAVDATGFPERHRGRLERLLESLGLPTGRDSQFSVEAIVAATHRDKKVRRDRVRYALPRRIGRMLPGGQAAIVVDDADLEAALRATG